MRKRHREAEERLLCRTAEFAFRFLRFYFCTCTFEYYQLQLKYPPGIPPVLSCERPEECNRTLGGKQAVVHIFSHSFPARTDATRNTKGQKERKKKRNVVGSPSNQKCTGKHEPCAHHLRVKGTPTRGGHSPASMLAPKLRMKTKSIVYLL